jgi:peptidoglycan/LPS O-acetylase OafA/YrhL
MRCAISARCRHGRDANASPGRKHQRLVYSQRFATDYLLALAVALHLIGIRSMIDRWSRGLAAVERPLRFLASCSFSVYLFHRPISIAISRLQPDIGDPIMTSLLSFLAIGGACLLLATITEHRLAAWRSLLRSNSLRPGARPA